MVKGTVFRLSPAKIHGIRTKRSAAGQFGESRGYAWPLLQRQHSEDLLIPMIRVGCDPAIVQSVNLAVDVRRVGSPIRRRWSVPDSPLNRRLASWQFRLVLPNS